MDLNRLATLKDKLVSAKDFAPVWTYFFDNFGEDPAFIALGERTHSPFLEAVLQQVGRALLQKDVTLTDVLLTHLPEHQFIHGACVINGALANLIYFEDVHVGALAVVTSVSPGETKMVRFTGRPLHGHHEPSVN